MKRFAVLLMLTSPVLVAENHRMTVEEILAETRYESAPHEGREHVRGMSIAAEHSQGVISDFSERYIHSRFDSQGRVHHEVQMTVEYLGTRRLYRSAQLYGEQSLPFDVVDRRFSKCSSAFLRCEHREVLAAELSRAQLQQGIGKGLVIRFESKKPGGGLYAAFSPEYIQAYLIKLDGAEAVMPREFALAASGK